MISIHFKKSRSSARSDILKIADSLGGEQSESGVKIDMEIKSAMSHWSDFNHLFWTTVKWKGTYLALDGIEYHSPEDMKRIFMRLQELHSTWMCFVDSRILGSFKDGKFSEQSNDQNEMADHLIDEYLKMKSENRKP